MDPNATLRMLDENLEEGPAGDKDERDELYTALKSWLDRGGFQPDWHKYLRATAYYMGRKQAEEMIERTKGSEYYRGKRAGEEEAP